MSEESLRLPDWRKIHRGFAKLVVVGQDAVRATRERFTENQEQLVTDPKPDTVGRPSLKDG